MANHTGLEGTVKIGANTIAEIRSYNYSESHDAIEDTAMGDTVRTFKAGISSWSGSVDVYWDETDTTGQGAMTIGTEVTVNFYPEGATTGDIYKTGSAIVNSLDTSASLDGMVEMSVGLTGNGALTEATVS
jgi:hypothetical protein